MAFTDQYALSQDVAFQQRVRVAMATAAIDIVGENQGSMNGHNHAKRHSLGVAVLNDPDSYVPRFALAVVTNVAITGASTDADIQFTVNSIWGDIAGCGDLN